jgi:hypothetical protein
MTLNLQITLTCVSIATIGLIQESKSTTVAIFHLTASCIAERATTQTAKPSLRPEVFELQSGLHSCYFTDVSLGHHPL